MDYFLENLIGNHSCGIHESSNQYSLGDLCLYLAFEGLCRDNVNIRFTYSNICLDELLW